MKSRIFMCVVVGAVTLAVAGLPAFAAEPSAARKAYLKRLQEKGAEDKSALDKVEKEKESLQKEEENSKLIDINFASKEKLTTLPGVTPELADKIIAGRPYREKSLLTRKKILPLQVFYGIADKININLDRLVDDAKAKAKAQKAQKDKERAKFDQTNK